MKKILGCSLLMILVYIVSLIATLPISLVVERAPIPKQIKLGDVKGSIWQGTIHSITTPEVRLEQVSYQFKPFALFTGKLSYALDFAGKSPIQGKGLASYSASGWRINDTRVFIDADWALQKAQLPLPMNAEGELRVDIQQLSQGQAWCKELEGNISWKAPALLTPLAKLEFANINAPLSCIKGDIQLQLQHKDRQIDLDATVLVKAKTWQSNGKLKAGADLPDMISNNMNMLGRADAQGYYRFKQQGRL